MVGDDPLTGAVERVPQRLLDAVEVGGARLRPEKRRGER
jgi:hypothetical protein